MADKLIIMSDKDFQKLLTKTTVQIACRVINAMIQVETVERKADKLKFVQAYLNEEFGAANKFYKKIHNEKSDSGKDTKQEQLLQGNND